MYALFVSGLRRIRAKRPSGRVSAATRLRPIQVYWSLYLTLGSYRPFGLIESSTTITHSQRVRII